MSSPPPQLPGPDLSPAELVERLRLRTPGLVEELYRIAKEQNAREDAREGNLNAKGTSLLNASGFSLTVAFTFGGLILQHPEYLAPLGRAVCVGISVVYGVALLLGLFAGIFAVRSLLVRPDYRGISEQDVFSREVLHTADRSQHVPQPPEGRSDAPATEGGASAAQGQDAPSGATSASDRAAAEPFEDGLSYYRRYMIAHLWFVAQNNFAVHENKASLLKRAQMIFLAFLSILVVIGIALAVSSALVMLRVR